jgi:centromeric protein E
VKEIFDLIEASKDREFLLRCSYVEIYNEVVRDLLNINNKEQVKIREHSSKGVYLDCHEECITSASDIADLLAVGEKHRHNGVTNMNAQSSRSHTIFKIVIESRERSVKDDGEDERRKSGEDETFVDKAVRVASLNLVDLAGSENAKQTGAEGERLREASNINKSLLTLARVISTLAANGGVDNNKHINFRDSKLTRILQVLDYREWEDEVF